ncbi:hypothetical protein DUNSADRAFT_374 [Dunaliella salina]|uniref:Uncharacterized protein n=1 Tax=Dunaliella salina TaxID=3046 RepID=A0ABQ7GYC1_DUNSA|nr:hypothetical protein DUNSADRAFT_374 [Dunaliella salina]|eukprot:KAF5839595.1 hypothetical protein DUNSADRAFT_374 [Dunaliella salina]
MSQKAMGIPFVLDVYKKFLGPEWQDSTQKVKSFARNMMVGARAAFFPSAAKDMDQCLQIAMAVGFDEQALKKEFGNDAPAIFSLVTYTAEFHVCQAVRDMGVLPTIKDLASRLVATEHRTSCMCAERNSLLRFAAPILCPSHSFMDGSVGIDGLPVRLKPSEEELLRLRTDPVFVILALEMWSVDGLKYQNGEAEKGVAVDYMLPLVNGGYHSAVVAQQLAKLKDADRAAHAFGLCLCSKGVWVLEVAVQLLGCMAVNQHMLDARYNAKSDGSPKPPPFTATLASKGQRALMTCQRMHPTHRKVQIDAVD